LKPGGYFISLTPNLGDYTPLTSKLIPNRFHPWTVLKMEGRKREFAFPVYYGSNTYQCGNNLAKRAGFRLIVLKYLGQYSSPLLFNPILFRIATEYEKLISQFNFRFLRGWLLILSKK
jgi:hypothetical protein